MSVAREMRFRKTTYMSPKKVAIKYAPYVLSIAGTPASEGVAASTELRDSPNGAIRRLGMNKARGPILHGPDILSRPMDDQKYRRPKWACVIDKQMN